MQENPDHLGHKIPASDPRSRDASSFYPQDIYEDQLQRTAEPAMKSPRKDNLGALGGELVRNSSDADDISRNSVTHDLRAERYGHELRDSSEHSLSTSNSLIVSYLEDMICRICSHESKTHSEAKFVMAHPGRGAYTKKNLLGNTIYVTRSHSGVHKKAVHEQQKASLRKTTWTVI